MSNYRTIVALAMLLMFACGSGIVAEEIVIPAREHADRSENVEPVDARWNGLVVCNGIAGMQQWDFDVETSGPFYIHSLYASESSRPVRLFINGQEQTGAYMARATGGYFAEALAWDVCGQFELTEGENSIKIIASGNSPHLAGLVVSSDRNQWNKRAFEDLFPNSGLAIEERIALQQEAAEANRLALSERIGVDEVVFIKRYPYTANHYYTEYLNSKWMPGGGICVLSLEDGSVRQIATELEGGVFGRMDLSFDATKVVFDWKRSDGEGYRIYEVGIDGTGLRQVLAAPEDEAKIVERYQLGYHNGTDDMHPCYLPDGGFAFISTRCQYSTLCNSQDAFTTTVLYRMDADGSNVRQLSHGALSEATPAVLPDGRIMYMRWEYVNKGAVSAKCLWAVRPDGTSSSEIYGNDIPFPPTMTQGRPIPGSPNQYVLLGCPHYPQNALGTIIQLDMNQSIRTDEPMTYLTPEVKILLEGGWHFQNPNETDAYTLDRSGQGPLFRDPYPIEKDFVLVAHKPRGFGSSYQSNGYGLYALDATQSEPDERITLFYRDPEISCWQPIPVESRVRPPLLSTGVDEELAARNMAKCIVTDVYHGLEDVDRGSIKYIRVLEQIPRPWVARRHGRLNDDVYDQQHAVVTKDTALAVKVQHGVVPVEEDGSAHFLVPADANIFFQALDENYLAVQTERTFVNYMPGETRSCIGCHETPKDGPAPMMRTPLAMRREASTPGPQIGETAGRRPLHYPTDVQPVLDRHCIECHNEERADGDLDLTDRMTQFFSVSYENLITERRGARSVRIDPDLVPTIGENHPKTGNVRYLPTRSLGSHNSLLMAMLLPNDIQLQGDVQRLERLSLLVEAHAEIEISAEDLLKISNWVDTNAQYYGSYYGRRNLKDVEHPNFRPEPTWESAIGICPLPEEER
jgi:hypothetical protein